MPTVTRYQLLSLQARASVLALAETNPARADRRYDDAHDLLSDVIGLLEDNGLSLIEDPELADRAFSLSHMGMLDDDSPPVVIADTVSASAAAIARVEEVMRLR